MILKKLTTKTLICLLTLALFVSCKSDKKEQVEEIEVKKDNAIEIVTRSMEFQTVDTITSGWNTFRYKNLSNEVHLFLMDKYPEGKTIENTLNDIVPPFQKGMDLINEGKTEEGYAEFGKIPAWFSEIIFSGGSGLVSPKTTSTTTINLKPGYYIMECYVKMPNGKFHTGMGMAKAIIVTEKNSGFTPPEANINITVSSTEGIQYEGEITNGKHIFSVYYKDQIVHENFLGHDVNLVKLDDNANIEALEAWMNWATPTGLMTPSPEGVTFLGGTNDSPAGSTQYFKANLEPGNYAFISEVPNTSKKGMLKTFTVSE